MAARTIVWVIAGAATAGAALSSAEPTGVAGVDLVLCGGFGLVLTLACSRARRWSWVVVASGAVVGAWGWAIVPALAAEVVAVGSVWMGRQSRRLGALVGALAVQALLRLPSVGFHGATALLTGAATIPVLVSAYRVLRRAERRRVRLVAGSLAGAVAIAVVVFGVLLVVTRADLQAGLRSSQRALDAARTGRPDVAAVELEAAQDSFSRADQLLGGWWAAPVRAVPVVGQNAAVLSEMAALGEDLSGKGGDIVQSFDYEDLRYSSGQVNIGLLRSLQGPLVRTVEALQGSAHRIDDARSPWLIGPVEHELDDVAAAVEGALPDSRLARQAISVAPGMLGADGPRRYFVAVLTPAELRGGGGFMQNFIELTAEGGRVRVSRSGRIDRDLNQPPERALARELSGPADYLARYGRFDPATYFQDVAFSPHFPSVAQVISQLYPQSGGRRLDGVISVDPIALAALLEITGPVPVENLPEPLTSANAADILLRRQYELFGSREERIDVLDGAARTIFDALTLGSIPGPRQTSQVLGPVTREGRLRMYSTRPDEQAFIRRIGADGALPEAGEHDFLSLTTQNSGNNKIDVFLHREVTYNAEVDPRTGQVNATVRVALRNDAPTEGLPSVVIGNTKGLPPGTNRTLLSVYTPHLLGGATLDGQPIALDVGNERGYRVYGEFLNIPPGATVTVELHLAGDVVLDPDYRLTVAPQPAANPDRYRIDVASRLGRGSLNATVTGAEDRRFAANLVG